VAHKISDHLVPIPVISVSEPIIGDEVTAERVFLSEVERPYSYELEEAYFIFLQQQQVEFQRKQSS
jgi:hypothetical protein